MVKITVELNDEEYLEAKRTGKSHREIYAKGLGRDYTPKPMGRPTAFDPIAYEQKMREQHLRKIREYDELHAPDVARAKRELGIDLKPGEKVPALDEGKCKKRV